MDIENIIISGIQNKQAKEEIKSKVQEALLSDDCSLVDMSNAFSGYMLQDYIDLNVLSKCIDKVTKDRSYNDLLDSIVTMVEYLSENNNTDEINVFVLSLVIDTNGFKRDLGRHLWDELNLGKSKINLLEMPEEIQGRFALSILQDYKNPDSIVAQFIMLFNSEFKSVRTMVYRVLTNTTMNYVMNYFGTVEKAYKTTKIKTSEESKMFEACLSDLNTRFEMACNCKELYPDYAMPEVYEYCCKSAQVHLKEQMKEAENKREDPLLKLMKKVVLGKGGGWRKQDGTSQPLAHFKFTAELPSMVNALSYTEQRRVMEHMFLDWNTIAKNEE